jgi:hypothetical protein
MWSRHFLLFDPRLQITPSGSVKIGNGIFGGGTLQNSEESTMEQVTVCAETRWKTDEGLSAAPTRLSFLYFLFFFF